MSQQAAVIEQQKQGQPSTPAYHIYIPSPRSFLVTVNYQVVSNWRDLQAEARAAVEPAIRERWLAHWQRVAQITTQAQQAENTEDLMQLILQPDMYYPCPPELAAKAER
jgi:hypothetical protein